MKTIINNFLILLALLSFQESKLQAQITRGSSPGEIYTSNFWYYDQNTIAYYAVFYSPNNGKDMMLHYISSDYQLPGNMKIGRVLGDAAPGVLYNYGWNELWVSFDYGASWEYIENHSDNTKFLTGSDYGQINKLVGAVLYESSNFGNTFFEMTNPISCPIREPGYYSGEFFGINGNIGGGLYLDHTLDYAYTYTETPIDSTVAFWQVSGMYPEISRGTEPGELYLISWWPEMNYKIFHSIDTGYTWVQKYESEYINLYYWSVQYSAGRQPGSFYVKRSRLDPTGSHLQVYIDYSNDNGQTFTTYFHELDSLYTSFQIDKNTTPYLLIASPNPFSNRTTLSFNPPVGCKAAKLNIYNLQAQLVRQFDICGKSQQCWDGKNCDGVRVPNGVYLYNIRLNNTSSHFNKLLLNH
jgi:hypothetical protein